MCNIQPATAEHRKEMYELNRNKEVESMLVGADGKRVI
jgi:hypothetical protein